MKTSPHRLSSAGKKSPGPPAAAHPTAAKNRTPSLPTASGAVKTPTIQTYRRPGLNNTPVTNGIHQQRNQHRPVTPPVIQRAVTKTTDLFDDEIFLLVMHFMGMRIGADRRPGLVNFALTSKRMYRLAMNQHSPLGSATHRFLTTYRIPAILQTYASTLEPLLHGAHLGVERLGLPGAGTILGLAINGRLIPWNEIPEDFQKDDQQLKLQEWEAHVKSKVTKYSELSITAQPERQ
jgi:hypothetical protein